MADDTKTGPKDGDSFFRKVVRFVANPATDWAELNTRQDPDNRDLEFEKSELKAMIERKRRNDFVRKREFDMLRKVRREGLSPEQLAALGGTSRIDAGDYGYCDETGEPIGLGRLLTRPTATLSLEAQQRREMKQKMFGD